MQEGRRCLSEVSFGHLSIVDVDGSCSRYIRQVILMKAQYASDKLCCKGSCDIVRSICMCANHTPGDGDETRPPPPDCIPDLRGFYVF